MYELMSVLPAWAPYAATGTGSAGVAAAIVWICTRRGRSKAPLPRSTSRVEDALTFTVAAIVAGICAQGMGRFFLDKLGFPLPIVIAVGGILELVAFTCALRARRALRETGTAGVDGVAVWIVAALSGTFSALDSTDAPTAMFRLVAALLAAWLWERGMAIERRRRKLRGLGDSIAWRVTPERVLVRLGVAEPSNRTATEVDTQRRLSRIARAAKDLRILKDSSAKAGRIRRATARLDKAVDAAEHHIGLSNNPALLERLMNQLGTRYNTAALAELHAHAPWQPPTADADPRPRICAGRFDGPGLIGLRLREPGRGFRTLHPAPAAEAPQPSATTVSLLTRMRERRTDRRLGLRVGRTDQVRTEQVRTDRPRAHARTIPDMRASATVRIPLAQPAWPLPPVRPTAPPHARTPEPPRAKEPHRTTTPHDRTARKPPPASAPRTGSAAQRAEVTAQLADEIRAAHADGRTWKPDYDALMARTGFKRRWCEARVQEAHAQVARTDRADAARPRGPHADTDSAGLTGTEA
ncbi:hypothetical protein [Actinomadura geliboluensis]|uniref:hypothetical protein n=1 Tax=Actinomadura geliboluensis TaxID=882440 RepID=UPI0036D10A7D